MKVDAVVIGGGAAGLFCALTAGRRGRRVVVVEHANRVGKKILMSGGGRCNFTNLHTTPDNYLSRNPHFAKSALARYTPADFIALVDAHRIPWHEKELGQLFCDDSAKQIVAMLLRECADAGVEIRTQCRVDGVSGGDGAYTVETSAGRLDCAALVVATGGLSIPKMGATGFGHALARQFGHALIPTRAGLVPFTLSGAALEAWSALAGVALPVDVACGRTRFAGAMLATHRGLSGPAMLQISSYWQPGQRLRVDLLPDRDAGDWLVAQRAARPEAELRNVLADALPRRVATSLCERHLGSQPLKRLQEPQLRRIGEQLNAYAVAPSATEGYRTAEVTLGGVDTADLSSSTMESRSVRGLYFVGEVVDVTGWLGGYNFQWAWASGHAAGQAL